MNTKVFVSIHTFKLGIIEVKGVFDMFPCLIKN